MKQHQLYFIAAVILWAAAIIIAEYHHIWPLILAIGFMVMSVIDARKDY